jgi:hypothetical protein
VTPAHADRRLAVGCYRQGVTQQHRRFPLLDVTFAGVPLPGATIDCWQDSQGRSQWQARVLTRGNPTVDDGELSGRTADGRTISGHVLVADRQVGPGGRRETLIVFHGAGTLNGV